MLTAVSRIDLMAVSLVRIGRADEYLAVRLAGIGLMTQALRNNPITFVSHAALGHRHAAIRAVGAIAVG